MIQEITSYFDVVFAMPIEAQCHFAIGLSFVGFVFAAFIRETCKQSLVRYGARIIGAASFFAVAAFANHVSHEYEKLNLELMVRKGQHDATQIADPVRVVAVASEFSQQCGNATFSITKYRDGRYGPVSVASGCFGSISDRSSAGIRGLTSSSGVGGTENGSLGNVPTGEHGRRF